MGDGVGAGVGDGVGVGAGVGVGVGADVGAGSDTASDVGWTSGCALSAGFFDSSMALPTAPMTSSAIMSQNHHFW